MKTLLFLLLIILPLRLLAAVGDITGAEIETNGWTMRLWVSGLNTNGVINNGFGTNGTPTAPRVVLTVASFGFNASGTQVSKTRTIYGTDILRLPYPNQAVDDSQPNGSGCIVRVSLSEFVYGPETLTLSTLSGAYAVTNGTGTNSTVVSGLSVTNNSSQLFQKPVMNWTWPGWQRETGTAMRLRAVGFHQLGAEQQHSLAAVKFIATDESGDAVTNIVTRMSVDRSIHTRGLPFGEYVSDFALASFTSGDQLRCDFIAYPVLGTNVFSTFDNQFTGLSAMPTSITNLCDPNSTHTTHIAVVEPVAGSDSNGRATNTTPQNVSSSHYFATIAGAWNFLIASNNLVSGHNTGAGGVVYIRTTGATNIAWTGGTITAKDNVAKCWAETTTYPGDTRATITNRATDRYIGHRTKLSNLNIVIADPAVPWNATSAVWFDDVLWSSSGATQPIQSVTNVFMTRNQIKGLGQGVKAVTTQNTAIRVLRQCELDGMNIVSVFVTAAGNIYSATNANTISWSNDGGGSGYGLVGGPNYGILYNNYFGGMVGSSDVVRFGHAFTTTNGLAVVQNVFEYCASNQNPNLVFLGTQNTLHHTNIIFWNNCLVGKRSGFGYNDSGSAAAFRHHWSFRNNIVDISGYKSDTFGTPDGGRVGNWAVIWGVGASGNASVEVAFDQGYGQFPMEFNGMKSFNTGQTNALDWPRYTNRKSYAGGTGWYEGGGNYALLTPSPLQRFPFVQCVPFDILGKPRGSKDASGPYSAGNALKGAFF